MNKSKIYAFNKKDARYWFKENPENDNRVITNVKKGKFSHYDYDNLPVYLFYVYWRESKRPSKKFYEVEFEYVGKKSMPDYLFDEYGFHFNEPLVIKAKNNTEVKKQLKLPKNIKILRIKEAGTI